MKKVFLTISLMFFLMGSAQVQKGNVISETTDGANLASSVAVDIDGNTMVLGAPNHQLSTEFLGQVQVYRLGNDTWELLGNVVEGTAVTGQFGYATAVSADGNKFVASAPFANQNRGEVKVYNLSTNTWNQVGTTIVGTNEKDNFGIALSMNSDGTMIAVASIGSNDTYTGEVKVFELSGNTWNQVGTTIKGMSTDDEFGTSISLSNDGTQLAIGATGGTEYEGYVKVYEFINNDWSQQGSTLVGEAANDQFGRSLELSGNGNRLIVGAIGNDTDGDNSGAASVYEFSTDWNLIGQRLTGQYPFNKYGQDVSISDDGNTVTVSGTGNEIINFYRGIVDIYKLEEGNWKQFGKSIEGFSHMEYLGFSQKISGNGKFITAGAPLFEIRNYSGNEFDKFSVKEGKALAFELIEVDQDAEVPAVTGDFNDWKTNDDSKWNIAANPGEAFSKFASRSLVASKKYAYLNVSGFTPGHKYTVIFDYEATNSAGASGAGVKISASSGVVSGTNFNSLGEMNFTTDKQTPEVDIVTGAQFTFTANASALNIVVNKVGAGGSKASVKVRNIDIKRTALLSNISYSKQGINVYKKQGIIHVTGAELMTIHALNGIQIKNKEIPTGVYIVTAIKDKNLIKLKVFVD